MASEAATYHRIRLAVSAAQNTGAVTTFSGSTELSLPAAAEYASNYMALERIRGVRVSLGSGSLEVGPAEALPEEKPPADRRRGDRRSGADRRKNPRGSQSRRDA